jgi:outer membrane protein OmpA-like peptidoglycan-associated protein
MIGRRHGLLLATLCAVLPARAGAAEDAADYASLGDLLSRRAAGEFDLRAELGVGRMLSSYQREELGFDALAQGTARLGLALTRAFSAQLSAGSIGFFAGDRADGQAFVVGPGVRFDQPLSRIGDLFVDANLGVAESVRRTRVELDAGAGFEFPIFAYVELGPFARYHHVFAATPDTGGDARFFSAGIAGSVRRLGVARPKREGPRDSDGDGVLDRDDLCPRTPSEPAPDPRRPGCPDRDDDADGIANRLDACPNEKPLPEADPARHGCPRRDRDRDDIADPVDACPDQRGVPGTDPKRHGCPPLVAVEQDRLRTLLPVFFATGEDRILPESEPVLRDIAEALRKHPQIRLSIEGHTDDTGNDAQNLELSKRRAESVRQALIGLGIDAARLEAHGFGRTRPLVPGASPEAREKNRRVELRVVKP